MSADLRDKEAADYLEGLMEGFVAYDGNIEAHSAGEGKGSEFVVSLPLL